VDGTDAGLPDFPSALLVQGKFNRASTIVGTNSDEFQCVCSYVNYNASECLFADWLPRIVPQLDGPTVLTEGDMRLVMEHALGLALSDSEWGDALAMYPSQDYGGSSVDRVSRMLVESAWIGHCETERTAGLVAAAGHQDIWVYHFSLPAANGKAMHFSDIFYVFGLCEALSFYCVHPNEVALQVSANFMGFWAALARNGEPTGDETVWPRYSAAGAQSIRIDTSLSLDADYRSDYCSFWQGIQTRRNSASGLFDA
jgi:hypothetical protein